MPRSTEEAAYKTLVRTKLEFAEPIWGPYYENSDSTSGENPEDGSLLRMEEVAQHYLIVVLARYSMSLNG